MRKLLASLALGLAVFGFAGYATAQEASAPAAEASAAAPAPEAASAPAADASAAAPAEAASAADAASAPPAPVPNKGDVSWMLLSTLLVIMMAVPGLALFYGGLVRSKNMLSVLMQVFVVFSLVVVLWAIYGYTLAFGGGGSFYGNFDKLFLKGISIESVAATFSKGVYIPELTFIAFQGTFAAITTALIVGAFAERIKFSAVLLFSVLWFTFSYLPVAHMVWYWDGPDAITDAKSLETVTAAAGFMWAKGALDFAGGTVVHINAGVAGLVGAYVIGKRLGYGRESLTPHRHTRPETRPITIAPMGPTKPAAGVTATRPATAPDAAPSMEALPLDSASPAIQESVAAAVATSVLTKASAVMPLASRLEPALNPNQPTQSREAPIMVNTRL